MVIKSKIFLLILGVYSFGCKKNVPDKCPKFGYEYVYMGPGISYTPGKDSISLGTEIIFEASAPRVFFDSARAKLVYLDASLILGGFSVSKATGNNLMPVAGGANDMEFTVIEGKIYKDTVRFTAGQLQGFRSVNWILVQDSFKLKISIKPLNRGTYFVGLQQQGNRDSDCALYKYFLDVMNPDQHLYFLAQLGFPIYNGPYYAYCFKVY